VSAYGKDSAVNEQEGRSTFPGSVAAFGPLMVLSGAQSRLNAERSLPDRATFNDDPLTPQ
jgi:hypothetical protein